MRQPFDARENYQQTKQLVGYVPRKEAQPQLYAELGFRCGLEIHQQLLTAKKLFCHCPAGVYQKGDDFDAEVIRHMRPTLSEMGEYDGTALMERKTRKNIVYRIKNETACTYEIDDTPPFEIDREALHKAIGIALLLKTNVVGELHITRKQYLDGSIPTGFQRTAIVGIEGEIPLPHKKVRIIQISIEEDSCREVSDIGHWRVYRTDRLGMPLIEMVTYPDMLTPDEAAEAGNYLRYLARSSGNVRTGIGAARQDVNVSVSGGTRIEIKGVAHIRWIPELTHNEAFRQKALLEIQKILKAAIPHPESWHIRSEDIDYARLNLSYDPLVQARADKYRLVAVNLPEFKSILSFFTQPGKMFADEISDRLKVIACLERPNLVHSEQLEPILDEDGFDKIRESLGAGENDAQIIFWGPDDDIATALETIEERCLLALQGIPNETRKSFPDGTTIFERVLPGPDRMYPDTDSAPIPIEEELIEQQRVGLPPDVSEYIAQLQSWMVPEDTYEYILRRNLTPVIKRIVEDFNQKPMFVVTLLAHLLKHLEGKTRARAGFSYEKVYRLFEYVCNRGLTLDIIKTMLPVVYRHPEADLDSVLSTVHYVKATKDGVTTRIARLAEDFVSLNHSGDPAAKGRFIMGQLRGVALGNVAMQELRACVDKELG